MKGIWEFVAGESRATPLAVAIAIICGAVMHGNGSIGTPYAGIGFVAIIVAGLVASIFERV
jgi:hypothetical protein